MANRWLATNIINSLKLRGFLPTSQEMYSVDDFLFLLDEGLRDYVVPILRESNREDYLTQHEDITLVSGTSRYPIPARAASEQLVLLQLADGNGGYIALPSIDRARAGAITSDCGYAWQTDDDAIILAPTPAATGTLRVHYVARPGRLVDESACGRVTALDATLKTVTISATPTTVTGSGTTPTTVAFATSQLFDFVHGFPGFRGLGVDRVCTNIASSVMTFTATLPTGLAVGDYVCIAGESPIAQVPEGVHPLLSKWAIYTLEMGVGKADRVDRARAEMERTEKMVRSLLSQQKGDTSTVVLNFNSPGWGRRRGQMR